MWLFENAVADGIEDFLILSGDHLYRCNYQDFVRKHRETGSDITVAALPCDPKRASAFGLMKIDDTGRITSFAEKPTGDALKAMEVDTTVLGLDADKAEVRCVNFAFSFLLFLRFDIEFQLLFATSWLPSCVKE